MDFLVFGFSDFRIFGFLFFFSFQNNETSILLRNNAIDIRPQAIYKAKEAAETAEREMRVAKNDAESANRTKSEFFAVVTHEIRTPLNGVIGFSDLLAETKLDATQRQFVATLRSSAGALMSVRNRVDFLIVCVARSML